MRKNIILRVLRVLLVTVIIVCSYNLYTMENIIKKSSPEEESFYQRYGRIRVKTSENISGDNEFGDRSRIRLVCKGTPDSPTIYVSTPGRTSCSSAHSSSSPKWDWERRSYKRRLSGKGVLPKKIFDACKKQELFFEACKEGDLARVKGAIEKNYVFYSMVRDDDGNTPLHFAALRNRLGIVRFLVKHEKVSADVNVVNDNDITPIALAYCIGWEDVVKYLIKYDAFFTKKEILGFKPKDKSLFVLVEDVECFCGLLINEQVSEIVECEEEYLDLYLCITLSCIMQVVLSKEIDKEYVSGIKRLYKWAKKNSSKNVIKRAFSDIFTWIEQADVLKLLKLFLSDDYGFSHLEKCKKNDICFAREVYKILTNLALCREGCFPVCSERKRYVFECMCSDFTRRVCVRDKNGKIIFIPKFLLGECKKILRPFETQGRPSQDERSKQEKQEESSGNIVFVGTKQKKKDLKDAQVSQETLEVQEILEEQENIATNIPVAAPVVVKTGRGLKRFCAIL